VLQPFLLVFSMKVGAALVASIVAVGAAYWQYLIRPGLNAYRIARRLREHEADLHAAGLQRVERLQSSAPPKPGKRPFLL
jgi:hypothetical protein